MQHLNNFQPNLQAPPAPPRPLVDYSGTVEKILSQVEYRDEGSGHKFLTPYEISSLSDLCSVKPSSSDDLGFADVDPDLMGQLVEILGMHVALAATVDIIQETYEMANKTKRREVDFTFDQWLANNGMNRIQKLHIGLESASIILHIVNSPGIDRRVVNEDAIESSIVLFRHNLSKHILPALNNVGHIDKKDAKAAAAATPTASAKKRRRSSVVGDMAALIRDMKKVYKHIARTIGITVLVMERLDGMIQKLQLDVQQLLTISAGALVSLELDPTNESSITMTHQLHVAALGLVTSIFRKYPANRDIIIEDLFPIMLRMPTSKKSMRTYPVRCSSVLYPEGLQYLAQTLAPGSTDPHYIQTISALILSLVQSSVMRPEIASTMIPNNNMENMTPLSPVTRSGLISCRDISDVFVKHLIQRCAKKGEDGGASEFRPILSNLIDDLLLVVLVPEYPAAEMILMSIANIISADMWRASDPKLIHNVEATYLSTAFDALGKICAAEARILKSNKEKPVRFGVTIRQPGERHVECYCHRTDYDESKLMLNCDRCYCWFHGDCVGLSRETVPSEWHCDSCQLSRIIEFERDRNTNMGELGCPSELIDQSYCMRRLLIDYLSILSRQTGIMRVRDAYGFHLAKWLDEFSPSEPQPRDLEPKPFILPLITRLMEFWDPNESSRMNGKGITLSGMLHCLSDEGRSRIVIHLASTQSNLLRSFRTQVGLIVKLMESDSSALLRKLAVKAVEKVTEADRGYMTHPIIKKTVVGRFSDEAISVREAAVSLVGSYVVHLKAVADEFHPAFMVGLNDSGVSVRKRTIKILQDILCSNPGYKNRAAACSEMLRLAADPKEDDGVRDLIYDLFLALWLENGDVAVVHPSKSPVVSPIVVDDRLTKAPGHYVEDLEEIGMAGIVTPTPKRIDFDGSPAAKSTRSTARKIRSRRAQMRSEIAAEQMIEVVKIAGSGEGLTSLFRELLQGVSDTDKDRKASDRKRRQALAQGHCSMLVDALVEILLTAEDNRASYALIGVELVAIFRTIGVFADVSPINVAKHLDTLLPYLKADNGLRLKDESILVTSLCDALSRISTVLERNDVEGLDGKSLSKDLAKITYKFGPKPCCAAVHALSALSHHEFMQGENPFRSQILELSKTFYKYLMKHRKDICKPKARDHVKRALSVLGSICRYHVSGEDEEEELEYDEDDEDALKQIELTLSNLIVLCKSLFLGFMEMKDPEMKCAALEALCGVFLSRPREMLYMDESGLITQVMAPSMHRSVQIASLRCWRDILLTEEARIESGEAKRAMDSKKNITLSKKISGDQDADATLFGGVLTSHASRLFEMTQTRDKALRFAALDLIGHLLRQGQVNPNEATPFLFALQGDVEEDSIRSLALKLLMSEGEKRPDMLRQRACAGVKQAYLFQKAVYPNKTLVSALVDVNRNGVWQQECVIGSVYRECIQSIRKQRQGLFRNLLSLFSIEKVEERAGINGKKSKPTQQAKTNEIDLALLSFTAQVLASLPFSQSADPLYIIYCISSMLALQGPDMLDRLASFLRPYGLAGSDEMDDNNITEDALEIAARYNSPQKSQEAARLLERDFDRKTFSQLCCEVGSLTLLLRLKDYLKKCYNLSESRCLEYNPEAKERIAEKVIARASTAAVFDPYLPLQGEAGTMDLDGMILQYSEFRQRMRAEASVDTRLDDSDDEENPNKRKLDEMQVEASL